MIRRTIIPGVRYVRPRHGYQIIRLNSTKTTHSTAEEPRINPVGIQHLSQGIYKQLFPEKSLNQQPSTDQKALIGLSQEYLKHHELLGKKTAISDPINLDLPPLQGKNLDEHFRRIALFSSKDYLETAERFAQIGAVPKMPKEWIFKSGWTKYPSDGSEPHSVEFPDEKALVFDVESMYKVSKFAVIATAVSETAWYSWTNPVLTGESDSYDHLIPMDTVKKPRLLIGHNVGYDRARIKEEYDLKESKAFFLDTMSLHIAASGMCSRQRPTWLHHNKQKEGLDISAEELRQAEVADPWVDESSPNSLAALAQFYCGTEIDKSARDSFETTDINHIKDNFQSLMTYCAGDVSTTHQIYSQVLPEFLRVCPHPVSFAALRFMGGGILTTNKDWQKYIKSAEGLYQEARSKVDDHLYKLALQALKLKKKPKTFENDPWLNQLDWTITEQKFKKNGEPYKNQKLPGYPQWYRDLYNPKTGKPNITLRTRVTPILLRLTWEGSPVIWSDIYGWCFRAEVSEYQTMIDKTYVFIKDFRVTKPTPEEQEEIDKQKSLDNLKKLALYNDVENGTPLSVDKPSPGDKYAYFRIPNTQGPEARTSSLLAKAFGSSFEKGILNSESPFAQEALKINASCSYWISARERIMSQFVYPKTQRYSIILPQVLTMGTVTRRAVEKTWLTASNAKKSRIGSELKSKIVAPKGYCLVGADVDSEELWIASLVGDSMFKLHGGTAIGWMTLEGTKSEGTDLHSKTASILGISRNEAKIFNYGRIYGAGLKFATRLLKQFNPKLTDKECAERAKNLYDSTKGKSLVYRYKNRATKLWVGGTESILFNRLESIAEQDSPKTPVLGAGITKALLKKNLKANSFLPSRVNWAIQSSGVDYLHLLCVSMNYLIKKYKINARLSLSVHDEIRYLVKEDDKYRAAMALQISNLWTRGIFCERLGISDVPQSCAFFSAVDIDHVLRKEVDMDCITPSNKVPIPPGESLDINQLMSKSESKMGEPVDLKLEKIELVKARNYISHQPKSQKAENFDFSLENPEWKKTYLEMQIAQSESEFKWAWNKYKLKLKNKEVKPIKKKSISKTTNKIESDGEPNGNETPNKKTKGQKAKAYKVSIAAVDAFLQNTTPTESKSKKYKASNSKKPEDFTYDAYQYVDYTQMSRQSQAQTKPNNNMRPKPKPAMGSYDSYYSEYGHYN